MNDRQSEAYRAATGWLYDRINYEKLAAGGSNYRFTLDRMRDLVSRLGLAGWLAGSADSSRPKIVHIAGTKGKGSTSTMVAGLLTGGGHRVGLYTSPHLVDLEERFRVEGVSATPHEMIELIDWVRPTVESMQRQSGGGPSFFELTTAMAVEHFRRSGCDRVVLETGLGGRLDSTNVFQSDVTAVTSIGLDHQHVLGDTLELIAGEKAGIFKPGVPAISGVGEPPARDVIRAKAASVGITLSELGRDFWVEPVDDGDLHWGTRFHIVGCSSHRPDVPVTLRLEGQHQARNAAVAMMVLDRCEGLGSTFNASCLRQTRLEARLERFDAPGRPTMVLDAAHNPDSIAALVRVVQRRFAGRRKVIVFGTSGDKDVAAMLAMIVPLFDQMVLTRYWGNPRYVPVDELAATASKVGARCDWLRNDDPKTALAIAIRDAGPEGVVVIAGSFFLAAELRPVLLGLP